MKNYDYKGVLKYTAAGMLLGLMLMFNALLLNYKDGFHGPWFHIFDYSPDFIIIAFCPPILALLFCFIGIRWQQLVAFNNQIKFNLSKEQLLGSKADQQIKLLGKVVSQINEAVMISDNEGNVLWINAGFTRITGYTTADVTGRRPESFLLGPLSGEIAEADRSVFKGMAIVEEVMHYRKDGTAFWASVSVKPIYNDAGELIHHIAIESDITMRKEKELALEKEIAERKELEKQLLANKNKLELAMEIAQFGAWEVDLASKTFYLSKELREIYHLPSSEEISMENLLKYIHPDDTVQFWDGISLAADGEKDEVEYRFIVDGEVRHMVSNITPEIDEQGNLTGYFGTVKDITKRKLSELALKKSEEEKAAVLNNAQTVICLHDFNGIIQDINIAAEKLSGYTKKELIGSSLKSIISPEYQQFFDAYLSEIITQKVAGGSFQITTKDGRKRAWLYQNIVYDNKTDHPYIIASAIDITESVKAQNEIERQEQFIHQIIDNSPNMVFVMNEQQQILVSNKIFSKYYHYNEKEIPYATALSKGADDIFLGDIESMLALKDGEMLRGEGCIAEEANDNSFHWFNIIRKCFKEKSGKKYFLGFGMDITERYKVEKDLIVANEMVERSLKVKDQFIANMSHEIRTPLNAVIGFTDLLSRTLLDKEQEEYIQIVKSASQNLLALINNILDLSKIESGNLTLDDQPMDVKQIVKDAVKILESKAKEKGIRMIANISDDLPAQVMGDRLRLSQILFNLLGNAVKFTDAGYVEMNCKLVQGPNDQKHYISFSVKDTGIGVAVEKQEIIFERFTQAAADTERLYGGTGLGLNIVKSIVDLHGGTLTIDSLPGKGTLFQFILSFKKTSENNESGKVSFTGIEASSFSSVQINILLAEDNLINAMLAKKVLSDRNFHVTHVLNGLLAVEAVQQQQFDIVLMDMQMPVMDGLVATKKIRSLQGPAASIPIVAMTAHSLYGEMQTCYDAGMNGYVSKPFRPDNLFAAISGAIAQKDNNKKQNGIEDMILYT